MIQTQCYGKFHLQSSQINKYLQSVSGGQNINQKCNVRAETNTTDASSAPEPQKQSDDAKYSQVKTADSCTSKNQHLVPSGITCFNYFLLLILTSSALQFSLSKCLSIRINGCDLYNVCVISCDEAFTGFCNLFFGEQIKLIALGIIFDGSLAVCRVI